ncbi:MAG TPA: sugar ABC transporter permease [Candidatus Hydrogenedentes bacterium]|nr:sugar ABC transporter permease [Candidatus Hydrogenedentota bacterium]HQE83580.1 sugar ABC transporter permease [Candidatus Hydrogenedentota bacterium]HQH53438.1 sugar ABC transporter permease [Candidatus Hydrogenedentota bacterium]HQM50064.1 sugar ABC transporter permease [Candidatus Hydrogenedentota bacterium]
MNHPARTHARERMWREFLASLVLCGPAVALYAGFIVLPALMGFGYSFTNWTGWTDNPGFVGLANFRELAADTMFRSSVRFTLFETVLLTLFFTFATMFLAVLLDKLRVMKGLVRGMFFYPYILSILVSALLFRYLANYREGAINILLEAIHLDALAQNWMLAREWAPYFVFALVAWSGLGFFTTLYLANLQTIPTDLYEAARIDGAGPLQVFTHVQFPMLLPTITTNSVLALITGINLFPQIVVTTQGAPGYDTFTIGYYIYHLGVLNNRQGYAAAVSFVTFTALVAVAAVQASLLRRRQVAL